MTRKACALVLASLVLGAPTVFASAAKVGPLRLDIPAGFAAAGPTQGRDELSVTAWIAVVPGDTSKTLLQASVYDYKKLPAMSRKALGDAAEKYLREFLLGIERRRTDYSMSPVQRMKLAELPAARAQWQGRVNGNAMMGVMYCVIVANRYVVSFHTQGMTTEPTESMQAAMQAIQAVQLAASPEPKPPAEKPADPKATDDAKPADAVQ